MKPENQNIIMPYDGQMTSGFSGVAEFYSNTFANYFIVESPFADKILVEDPAGRIILEQKIQKERNRVQSKRLPSGIYFVRFVNQSQTFKMIKR
jgi:hypothetical protein